MAPHPEAVYATLLISDSYLPGVMVLAHSLRDHGGAKTKLVVLVTLETVSATSIDELKTVYDEIIPVNTITNKNPANLYLMDRPDLVSAFTKIELWKQTQFRRMVYIDADTVVLRAPNELLQKDTFFAAVPDIGWPDCFNSGVMVLSPNMGDYYSLLALAQRGISFDGADQGLLNMHFRDWDRLSFVYNCTPSGNYQYVPAYRHFQSSISIVHFIGQDKPWVLGRYSKKSSGVYDELLGRWWAVYDRHYRSKATQTLGQGQGSTIVPRYVHGEAHVSSYGYSTEQPKIEIQSPPSEHQSPFKKREIAPTPTSEHRQFTAPMMEWDPTRAPPPAKSRPEAANLRSDTYTMSSDRSLFQAPAYPEPPKGMWYEVPAKAPQQEKLQPLFPWETRAPRPTRVFPKETPLSPSSEIASQPSMAPIAAPSTTTTTDETGSSDGSVSTPTAPIPDSDPWQAYTRTNAWDEVPEIHRYVRAFQKNRQGKVQVVSDGAEPLGSPTTPERRPSLLLTDFPDEFDRPSLPVTPAPIRSQSTFWGVERDSQGDMPGAEGVPAQEEWNPALRLEELQRRQSEVLGKSPTQTVPERPKRQMPESSSREEAEAADLKAMSPLAVPHPGTKGAAPTFTEPTYDGTKDTAKTAKTVDVEATAA